MRSQLRLCPSNVLIYIQLGITWKYGGTHAHWRVWMFDRGLTALHNVKNEVKLTDGRWRLMDSLCHYTSPWKKYTKAQVYEEYAGEPFPCEQYIHHFLKRYEGEVAFAWDNWNKSPSPLARDAELWDQQCASDETNYAALGKVNHHVVPGNASGEMLIHQSLDLTTVGNTNIIIARPGVDGHWHVNGGAMYTVAELFLWYYQAPKVCRRRQRSWGHPEKIAASWQRLETYGNRRHPD